MILSKDMKGTYIFSLSLSFAYLILFWLHCDEEIFILNIKNFEIKVRVNFQNTIKKFYIVKSKGKQKFFNELTDIFMTLSAIILYRSFLSFVSHSFDFEI